MANLSPNCFCSQKATISEIEARLDEERNQRRGERQKAAADLNSALKKAQLEAQEEIKRQSEIHLRQHKEQQEVINKLEVSEVFLSVISCGLYALPFENQIDILLTVELAIFSYARSLRKKVGCL